MLLAAMSAPDQEDSVGAAATAAAKTFQRCPEDFECGNCGHEIEGNGYTNHCTACLWSKHVDVNPGDRAADCHGLMKASAPIPCPPASAWQQCLRSGDRPPPSPSHTRTRHDTYIHTHTKKGVLPNPTRCVLVY